MGASDAFAPDPDRTRSAGTVRIPDHDPDRTVVAPAFALTRPADPDLTLRRTPVDPNATRVIPRPVPSERASWPDDGDDATMPMPMDLAELDAERTVVAAPRVPAAEAFRPGPARAAARPTPAAQADADPDATIVHREPPRVRAAAPAALARVRTPARNPAADVLLPSSLTPLPPLPKTTQALALPVGFRLHEYRIDGVVGQGGFGITYLATDVHLNTRVAIKEYLPAEIAFRSSDKTVSVASSRHRDVYQFGLDSFLVEARTLATFRHPNIVRVARFFEAHQTAYMVLEYERGQPLMKWWPEHRGLPESELMALLQPLLDGLAVVHDAGFLHRDIKPENIQVRRSDGSLVLLDFGSARQAAVTAGQAHIIVTPGYAPIEQYENRQQGAFTDIYALGATLYWLVTGRKPVDALHRMGQTDPMTPASEAGKGRYSPAFLAAIDWALQPRPEDRPQNLHQWRGKLFEAHAATLGLQEALRAGDGVDAAGAARRWRAGARGALRTVLSPSAWPLAFKMSLAMVLTALLPMLTTAYYNLHGSLAAVSASELRNLEQLARSTAGRVSQLVGDSRNLARSIGTDADYRRYLMRPTEAGTQALRAKVSSLAQSNPDIHLIMVMDARGTAVVSSDPEVMGRNFAFREYFRAAMQGREHITGIVVGAVAGQAGVFYAHPVFDDQNRPVGAVVLRIHAASIAAILDEVRNDPALTPFLLDGDGVLIHHPDPSLLYRSLAPLPDATMAAIRADQRFRRDEIQSVGMPVLAQAMVGARTAGHVSYISSLSGQEEIAGYAPVQGHDWVVAVSESRANFEAPLTRLFTNLMWSVLLVGLLFLGLSLRFARSVVRPIEALTSAAHALKSGDYARAQVTVRGRDEIGQLARTFNVMIDVLRQRERERGSNGTPGGRKP